MQPAAQQVESILAAAVEMGSVAERRAFLDQACAGDAKLKRRVEELIENHFRAGSFLESPVVVPVTTAAEPVAERPGTVVGPYKLLEQIGEGGFGVVFLAEQTQPVRRKVALKVLKPGMDSKQVVARFEAERQALALMDHLHIAKVFDGGATASGRPFFVMELVKGVPITEFCDQNHLTPRQRLELFLSVCRAVQHAHQKGIIHRDLKPSNVLVTVHDTTPVVKVIDFGVAKALGQELTDKTLCTGFAQMVGTPLYMSPEQAQMNGLDIDTRSDIFSLGVLLYELLTGTTPVDKERLRTAGYDELRRILREEEPPRPSTRLSTLGRAATTVSARRQSDPKRLSRLCRGELDWVVMKALEKDRGRRYDSAGAFAADVQRYLKDEPVHACPPSAWYRFRKFARRNKAALAVATALALAVLLGGANWLWWAQGRAAANGAVAQAMAEARKLRDQARAKPLGDGSSFREALAAARKAEELARAGAASDELRQQAAGLGAELEGEVAAADRDRRLLARLLDVRGPRAGPWDRGDARGLPVTLAEPGADGQFAAAFRDWGLDVDGTSVAQAAARLKGRPAAVVTEMVAALDEWASERRRQGKPPAEWQRLADLAAALDDQPDSRRRELRAILMRGNLPLERALAALSRALLPLSVLTGEAPGADRDRLRRLAERTDATKEPVLGLLALTRALQETGDDAVAERLLREAVRARPAEVVLHDALGKLLEQQRPPRWGEAVECYVAVRALRPELGWALARAQVIAGRSEEGSALCKKLVAEKPDNPWLHSLHGYALYSQGKPKEAAAALREAIRLKPDFAEAHGNLGVALYFQAQYQEAEAAFREAIRLKPDIPGAHNNLGALLCDHLRRYPEAEAEFREALRLQPDHYDARRNLGNALSGQGRYREAEAAFREAIANNPKDVKSPYIGLASALENQGKYDEALAVRRQAVAINPKNAIAHSHLGYSLKRQGKLDEAIAAFSKAIEVNPKYEWAWKGRGGSYAIQGQWKKASADLEKLTELHPDDAAVWCEYACLLVLQGDTDGYRQVCRRVVERFSRSSDPNALDLVARTCTLAPNAVPDLGELVRLAEKAVATHPDWPWYLHTLGIAHYRAGHLDKAVRQLQESLDVQPGWCHVLDWLPLAMAHSRLGNAQEAQQWLDKAVQWIDKTPRDPDGTLHVGSMIDHLECLLLRRDAEALLKGRTQPPAKTPNR